MFISAADSARRSGAVSLTMIAVFIPRSSHSRAVSNMSEWGAPPAYLVIITPSALNVCLTICAATMQFRLSSSSCPDDVVATTPAKVISFAS